MADKNQNSSPNEDQALEIEVIKKRLDLLDERLDNIDSVITAAVERVMSQPLSVNITCPHCGKNVEIGMIGNYRKTG